jgi:hypothetical protein
MALGVPHMLNMWIGCQGANDEFMERAIERRRNTSKKTKREEKQKLKHLNEPQRSSRKTNAFLDYSKQTNQAEKYVKHLKMFIDPANRNCSLLQKFTVKLPSYTSTADFEMPHHLQIKITRRRTVTQQGKSTVL